MTLSMLLMLALVLAAIGDSNPVRGSYDQEPGIEPVPESMQEAADEECPLVRVIAAQNATVIRARPQLQPGPLFSGSGAFAEKEVGEACDPGQTYGPASVAAGGKLRARLTGGPAVPQRWSLYNRGTGVRIVFEPLLGAGNYGPAQEVAAVYIPAEETSAEIEGSWSGPGRLTAMTTAPAGAGPLSGSCFEQSYTLTVEVIEAAESEVLQTGMTLQDGDRIVSDEYWGRIVLGGSKIFIQGGEVTFSRMGAETLTREGTFDLQRNRPPGYGDTAAEKVAEKLAQFRQAGLMLPNNQRLSNYSSDTLSMAFTRIVNIDDPCRAALELKLYLDANQFEKGPEHLIAIGADAAAGWLLPNNWDVVEGWGKWAFRKFPLIGYASTAQNVLNTWDQVTKEMTPTIRAQEGIWTLAAFDRFKAGGWSVAEVNAEVGRLHAESQKVLEDIQRLGQEFEAEILRVETSLQSRTEKIERQAKEALQNLDPAALDDQASTWYHIKASEARRIEWERATHHLELHRLSNEYKDVVEKRLTEVARLQAELTSLTTYARPVAAGDCLSIKPPDSPLIASSCLEAKVIEVTVKKGILHVFEQRGGKLVKPILRTIITNIDFEETPHKVVPDGTEYSVERRGESAVVRVYDGQVTIVADGQENIAVMAGQQISLPDRTVSPVTATSFGRVIGLQVAELPLESDIPEPYGVRQLDGDGQDMLHDWLWQDTDPYLMGPGDAKLERLADGTLQVTVPHENEFYRHRHDAPRLLHKVTGDFDLEAVINLVCRGGNHAFSQFVIFTPDTPIGFLAGEMNPGGLDAHYLVLGGGRAVWMDVNKLPVFKREWTACDDSPAAPIRIKLSRRGDQLKTYWSTDEGQTWVLASRHVLALPETFWAGWVFRRMAHDGLVDEPAVTTLSNIQLVSAQLNSMGEADWDAVHFERSTLIASPTQVLLAQDGTDAHPVQALSARSIAGNFDLIASYDAWPTVLRQGEQRSIQLSVASKDENNLVFVRHSLSPESQRIETDMYLGGGAGRYRSLETQNAEHGRIRITRQNGILSTYLWHDQDWLQLSDWQLGFEDPLYIDLRYQWQSPIAALRAVRVSIERLETESGLLIGDRRGDEVVEARPGESGDVIKPRAADEASTMMSYRHPDGLFTIPLPTDWTIHYGMRGRMRDADYDTLSDLSQERMIICWRGSEPAPDPIAALDKFRTEIQAATSSIRDVQSTGYSLRGTPVVQIIYIQPESGNLICRMAAISQGRRVQFDMVSRILSEQLQIPEEFQSVLSKIQFATDASPVPLGSSAGGRSEQASEAPTPQVIARQLDAKPRVVGINAVSAGTPAAVALGIESPLGAAIAQVYPDTPAARAGLRAGDLIVQFGQHAIENLEDLEAVILTRPVNSRQTVTYIRGTRRLQAEVLVAGSDDRRPVLGRFTHATGDFYLETLPAWTIHPSLNRDSDTRRLYHLIDSSNKNYVFRIFRDSPPARDAQDSLNTFAAQTITEFSEPNSGILQIGKHSGVFISGDSELDGRRYTLYRVAFVINQKRHQIDIFAPPLSNPAEIPFVAKVILGSLVD
ncbi:MAG TPA: PDZ domain-containing protein [Pirellulaceae bacterium]|nr:PDZ domain-containing protein [Pirellulaceae bacterium]